MYVYIYTYICIYLIRLYIHIYIYIYIYIQTYEHVLQKDRHMSPVRYSLEPLKQVFTIHIHTPKHSDRYHISNTTSTNSSRHVNTPKQRSKQPDS